MAAAVAYSRVHTGVHWPTDVAAGAAIGVAAGLATRRWWPLGADEPASAHPHSSLPAIENGEGVLVLVNPGSGVDGSDSTEEVLSCWPKATVVHPEGDNLIEYLHKTIDEAEVRRRRSASRAATAPWPRCRRSPPNVTCRWCSFQREP
ncbi:phosphatase PAP2 family protein [Kibdelosporangium philippinense]|uniref:phosphatase PAP2 family protein n=1 Tax=Kibdelosporangium philippinense TaxID=211113 RepID=UPI0036088BE4